MNFRRWDALCWGGLVLLLDQVSKFLVQQNLPHMISASIDYPYGGIGIFRDLLGVEFALTHWTNKGAAWGAFQNWPMALVVFRLLIVSGLFYAFFKHFSKDVCRIPFAIILGAALGNIADAFTYGHVIDMFHFVFWGYHYPVFNIADASICLSVVAMLWFQWRQPRVTG